MCTPAPFLLGVEPLIKFSKRGDLVGPQLLEGVAFFMGGGGGGVAIFTKIESEIFNDKKIL